MPEMIRKLTFFADKLWKNLSFSHFHPSSCEIFYWSRKVKVLLVFYYYTI